jgi:nitrogen regulatory protein PII-like uncharacterized protein
VAAAALVAAAAVEEAVEAAVSVVVEAAEEAAVLDQVVLVRCIKQLVQTVVKRLKFLSYPVRIDRCTAGNASKSIDQNDINLKLFRN